ncbi:hypothetical protein OS493_034702 [Desmophyllum pertusum]|uniref:Uncharacterized protein n=1 Tax=Desmophyllum pertusum TaxID=174260 RepID=A0A9X0CUU5_9CNID|nr:hypothetical protein OS493_034702 [Desmophyllum pertusum]
MDHDLDDNRKQEEVNKPTRKDTRNSGSEEARLNQTRIHQLDKPKDDRTPAAPARHFLERSKKDSSNAPQGPPDRPRETIVTTKKSWPAPGGR